MVIVHRYLSIPVYSDQPLLISYLILPSRHWHSFRFFEGSHFHSSIVRGWTIVLPESKCCCIPVTCLNIFIGCQTKLRQLHCKFLNFILFFANLAIFCYHFYIITTYPYKSQGTLIQKKKFLHLDVVQNLHNVVVDKHLQYENLDRTTKERSRRD